MKDYLLRCLPSIFSRTRIYNAEEAHPQDHTHAYLHSAQSSKMSFSEPVNGFRAKPSILLCGDIVLAHEEWRSLEALANLKQFNHGDRETFLRNCKEGHWDDAIAIYRTWDSTDITGRFDQELVNCLPSNVRFVCHCGAGYDSVNAEACAKRGIAVSNTSGVVNASTASMAVYLLLGALRRSHIPSSAVRQGQWRGNMKLTHDPEGKVIGILGMGGIGTAFAQRIMPFGVQIQYHNRKPLPMERNVVGAKYVGFEELIRTSDIISIHLPLNETTHGMIGRKQMAMMKSGVVLINTARGPIVDETALVEALESGSVWAAGLDVYEKEPVIHEGLLKNDHCVLMPHAGTATLETQRKMELLVMENLRMAILEGRLKTPVGESTSAGLGL